MMWRRPIPAVLAALALASCARAGDQGPISDSSTEPDITDADDIEDSPADDSPGEPVPDVPDAPDLQDTTDALDAPDATDPVDPDTTPEVPDPDADPDPVPDPGEDTGPIPCSGSIVGGCCWYLGGGTHPSCSTVCASHGGYSTCTRTYAGSDGTDTNCDSVLDALGIPYPGTTSTLVASGAGVGCFYQDIVDERYRVADTPTAEGATFLLARRACACNN